MLFGCRSEIFVNSRLLFGTSRTLFAPYCYFGAILLFSRHIACSCLSISIYLRLMSKRVFIGYLVNFESNI